MKSLTSLFKWAIIRQNLRQFSWAGILSLIGLLILILVNELLADHEERLKGFEMNISKITNSDELKLFIIFSSIVMGLLVTRYLQVKVTSNVLHSLPVTRSQLLFSHLASGSILILTPIWLTAAVSTGAWLSLPYGTVSSAGELLLLFVQITIFSMFFYLFTVLIGTLIGQTVLQGIVSFGLLVTPALLAPMIQLQLSELLYGYSTHLNDDGINTVFSPIVVFMENDSNLFLAPSGDWWILISYIVVMIAAVPFTLWLVSKRPFEQHHETILFNGLKPVFKYTFTFLFMIFTVGFMLIYLSEYDELQVNASWLLAGYAVSAGIGFYVSEMLLQWSWRVFKRKTINHFAVYFLFVIITWTMIWVDVTGYETRIPDGNEIANLTISNVHYYAPTVSQANENPPKLEPLYIERVRQLHKQIIEKRPTASLHDSDTEPWFIIYMLKNGSQVAREYRIRTKDFEQELLNIKATRDYKRMFYQFDQPTKNNIAAIRVQGHNAGSISKSYSILDTTDIQMFHELVKQDILDMNVEEIDTFREWGTLTYEMTDTNRVHSIPWKKSFRRVNQWLDQRQLTPFARLTADDFAYADILLQENVRTNDPNQVGQPLDDTRMPIFPNQKSLPNTELVKRITDREQITVLLERSYYEPKDSLYVANLYTENREDVMTVFLRAVDLPNFLR